MITLLSLTFQIPLITALILAAKEDIAHHEVSIKKQLAIALISIPLILINWENINIIHFIFIFTIIILYKLGMGGADAKILIPLSLTLGTIPLWFFVMGFNALGLIQGLVFKTEKVAFVPAITLSYYLIIWM